MAAKALRVFRRNKLPGEAEAPMNAVLVGPGQMERAFEFVLDQKGKWTGGGTTTLCVDPTQVIEVMAEGCEPGVQADLVVETTVRRFFNIADVGNDAKAQDTLPLMMDRCRVMTSPVIGITPLATTDGIMYGDGYSFDSGDESRWIADVQAFAAPIVANNRIGPELGFPQDLGQPAYTAIKARGANSVRRVRPILLQIDKLPSDIARRGVGIVQVPHLDSVGPMDGQRAPTAAQGGNIECLPKPGDPSLRPFTWVRFGSSTTSTDFDRFFEKRCFPRRMTIMPIGSLPLSHIDEALAVVPTSNGFKLCVADLEGAKTLIQGNVTFEKFQDGSSAIDVRREYADAGGPAAVTAIDQSLTALVTTLRDLGYPDADILRLPVLIKPNTGGRNGVYQPNGVNLQSIGGKVAVPNPFCAPIRDRIQQILKTAGVPPFSKPFLDTWGPHQRLGNIHCATLLFLVHIPEGLP